MKVLVAVPHAISSTDVVAASFAIHLYRRMLTGGIDAVDVVFGDVDRRDIDLESRAGRGTAFRRRLTSYVGVNDVLLIDVHSMKRVRGFPDWFVVDTPPHKDTFTDLFCDVSGQGRHAFSNEDNDLAYSWERSGQPALMIEVMNDTSDERRREIADEIVRCLEIVFGVIRRNRRC